MWNCQHKTSLFCFFVVIPTNDLWTLRRRRGLIQNPSKSIRDISDLIPTISWGFQTPIGEALVWLLINPTPSQFCDIQCTVITQNFQKLHMVVSSHSTELLFLRQFHTGFNIIVCFWSPCWKIIFTPVKQSPSFYSPSISFCKMLHKVWVFLWEFVIFKFFVSFLKITVRFCLYHFP